MKELYLNAIYEIHFDGNVHSLRIGQQNAEFQKEILDRFQIEQFAIITGYNPGSTLWDEGQNLKAHTTLGQKINKGKWDFLFGINKDPEGKWPDEKAFMLWPITVEKAVELGREFGQKAIVHGNKKGELQLIWCSPEKE